MKYMDDNKLLDQIAKDIKVVKLQLNNVEMKVELVNKKVDLVSKKVEQSQEETVDALSELIHEGYNLHEKRIKKLEEHLQSSQTQ